MHSHQPHFSGKPMQPLADQFDYYMQNAPMSSLLNGGIMPPGIKPLMPFHSFDIQPSDACPRNFVIFDQTTNRSQIMYHPGINSKFFYPGLGVDAVCQDNINQKDANDEIKLTSPLEEDSDDIDALLSTENEENEDFDDEEVSTARTGAVYKCDSPDSCSNYESPSEKSGSLFRKFSGSCCNDKKRQRTRKMVKVLRGIVPGASRMSTVAVLDEAVRYLKSLRVEAQKLGARNFKDHA
ncbi:transcription factor bHLH144 [Sesamum indicum]|uniref:transcription factor bHLH144 n=1 Tax=Sesamum indicum TaxID=4182 RepID=A0A6I9UA88_SESIN|nr:transcription factor bHLH144 [Sesamum indicum]XP_011096525.1 transcription factor bHLH144 [Sesamum indicum]XP_011096526.1 transcription factor bHLH144 [Sesamum indicum]XP_020554104.1 transcription factor bHLH144 [Sesamum indicum]